MNHLELVGVETDLKSMLYSLNAAMRDGTLRDVADALAAIQNKALMSCFTVSELLRRTP